MQVTAATLAAIAGSAENGNMRSTIEGLQRAGVGAGLERPHRLAMYLGQLSHESMGWVFDREVWGPTAAQKRYEGRADLGNTQPGDGSRFRGRGPIQITGRANYTEFTAWARKMDSAAPNFVTDPDAINTDPWEGLVPIWFWDTRKINRLADAGDYEAVTRKINGGLNGYSDRQERYAHAALALMGRNPRDIRAYQMAVGLKPDGVVGENTIASLHKTLTGMPPVMFTRPKPTVHPPIFKPEQPSRITAPSTQTWLIIGAIGAAIAAFVGLR